MAKTINLHIKMKLLLLVKTGDELVLKQGHYRFSKFLSNLPRRHQKQQFETKSNDFEAMFALTRHTLYVNLYWRKQ